jgi:hypothetical protein
MPGHFILRNSEHNDFDEQFKKSTEKKVKDIFRKSVDDDDEHLKEAITNDEISLLCSRLKCGKAGGLDNITYEHLKYGGRFLNEHLAHLFNLVIKYEFILIDWKYGCIITLHKGGNKSTKYPNNYRGITLLPVIFKLFENVIANRLPEIVDSDNFPCKQQMAYQK